MNGSNQSLYHGVTDTELRLKTVQQNRVVDRVERSRSTEKSSDFTSVARQQWIRINVQDYSLGRMLTLICRLMTW